MPTEEKPPTKTTPQKSSSTKICVIIAAILVGLPILLIIIWIILQFFLNPKVPIQHPGTSPTPTPTPTAIGPLNIKATPSPSQSTSASGSWTLSMSDTTISSAPSTSLDGKDSGQVSFNMPSAGQSVTATGNWSGHASGSSGPSTVDGTVSGKMTITGQIVNNKLHFTVSYAYSHCSTTITTPLGATTNETCPTSAPTTHSLDIETSDNATASYSITSAAVKGTENWTLKKN